MANTEPEKVAAECGATGNASGFCYHNSAKIGELEESIKEMRQEMRKFRDKSDERDDEIFQHLLSVESRLVENEKQYAVLVQTNTDAINHLGKTLDHMSVVSERMGATLNDMDKKMVESRDHATATDNRIEKVEDDVTGLKGSLNDVRKEIRTVDEKGKIDVVQTWGEQAKKNVATMLGGAGIFGVILALIEYFKTLH